MQLLAVLLQKTLQHQIQFEQTAAALPAQAVQFIRTHLLILPYLNDF